MRGFRRRSNDDFRPRDVRWADELRQDVRYALRALSRSPGFAVVAILTPGLGIGANAAIFSVVNAVLLRPLPYRDPASLVLIETAPLTLAESWLTTAWRERAKTVSDFAGFNGPTAATLVAAGEPEQVQSASVTWNLLSLLGVAPMAGRDFGEADAFPGAPPVALLSHGFWTARFSGDASIVGHTVSVNGVVVTVVGVMPATFRFPAGAVIATRLVGSMVYGVTPLDPATFAMAGFALVSAALTATWLPARRATRMDPLIALRSQ